MNKGWRSGKSIKRVELASWLAGVLLLGAFALAKGWSSQQSQDGIAAFEAARAAGAQSVNADAPDAVGPRPLASQPDAPASGAAAAETASPTDSTANEGVNPAPAAELPAVVLAEDPVVPELAAGDPDFSLWSEKRVFEYKVSQAASLNAPKALLSIESLGLKVPVYDGTSDFNLNRGAGRVHGTARWGEGGNLAIAGHRDGFFRPLKDIRMGDLLVLETLTGTIQYRVSSITIVDKTDTGVLAPSDTPMVTLVTCYPFYFVGHAPQRFIVKAEAINHQVSS